MKKILKQHNEYNRFEGKVNINSKSKKNPQRYKSRAWMFAAISFASLFIVTLILAFSGQFLKDPASGMVNNIILGQTVKLNLRENAASVTTLAFNGTALPGDVYNQDINLVLAHEDNPCYVRARFYVLNSNGQPDEIKVSLMENWIRADDKYYYYTKIMQNGQNISLTKQIALPESFPYKSNEICNIAVVVETIKESLSIEDIWATAPKDFVSSV